MTELTGLYLSELTDWCKERKLPGFRAKQILTLAPRTKVLCVRTEYLFSPDLFHFCSMMS